MSILLDTHILLWWFEAGNRLSSKQKRILDAVSEKSPVWVSDISLWETATLFQLGRIRLRMPLVEWLTKATAPPLVKRIGITPRIAAEVAILPPTFHRDPADRILVASARVLGARLLTQDSRIIGSGMVSTVS